jgi:hypothetical protein
MGRCAGTGHDPQAAPIPPCQKMNEAARERENRKGNALRPDKKCIQIQYTRRSGKKQRLSGKLAKKFCQKTCAVNP